MSADNYYVICRHPNGGFAAIMCFASAEYDEPIVADSGMESFPTLQAAESFAREEYTEYGVHIQPDCWDTEPKGISFTEREKELLQVLLRSAQDEGYVRHLFNDELNSIIAKLGR